MSRPEKQLTEQELAEIETMAGLGLSQNDIASIKGVCGDTLKKHANPYLKRGRAKARAQVAQTAYRMAISGKIPAMTMFWLKTQAGWREGIPDAETVESNLSSLVERINQSNKPSQVLLAYLSEVLEQLRQGVMNSKVAASMAKMSAILLKAAEQGQLEERLSELERVIKAQAPEPLNLDLELDEPLTPLNSTPVKKGNVSHRLEKLEANVTPKRLILKHMKMMLSFDDQDDWLKLFYSDEFEAWFDQALENMRTTARQGIQEPEGKHKAMHLAHKESIYLYEMALWPSQYYEDNYYRIQYQFLSIGFLLRSKRIDYLTLWSEETKSNISLVKQLTEQLWRDLKIVQLVESKIREHFFDGQPLLRANQQEFLDDHLNIVEKTLEWLEMTVDDMRVLSRGWRRKKGGPEFMAFLKALTPDRALLLQEVEQRAEVQFSRVKRDAKIAVYQAEDRHDEIRKMCQQMVNENATSVVEKEFEDL